MALRLRPPSLAHWFGTDYLGRDVYARVVHGAALSLKATVIAVSLGLAAGCCLGLLAGFAPRGGRRGNARGGRAAGDPVAAAVADGDHRAGLRHRQRGAGRRRGHHRHVCAADAGRSAADQGERLCRGGLRQRRALVLGAAPPHRAQRRRPRAGAGGPGTGRRHPCGIGAELPGLRRRAARARVGHAGGRRAQLPGARLVADRHAGRRDHPGGAVHQQSGQGL
ncbi:hypothetical protein WJ972_06670 [Achromobacter insuavis]